MGTLFLLVCAWFFLPLLSQVLEVLTTPVLARASVEIDGFWDAFNPNASIHDHTTSVLIMDSQDLAELNAEHPLSTAVEPPKGSWK